MDNSIKKEVQSAAFERLVQHLRERKDVQNIDLMNLAGFCRNCLSKWLREEAQKLYQTAQDYLNKSFTSNWDGIYGLQHPKFRKSVSIEEFIYFNGIIEVDYRNNGRSHVSGGYGYPTTEFIKKNI